ncbi:fumarylacetoacetate hydrolase family protein [Actinophytocola sp.]|uniref:fumarylacetoacetate hydrolase family protein n=1 Tax=Actinophytocola sp. TaxID=1872138 RepID=UPI003D6A74A9
MRFATVRLGEETVPVLVTPSEGLISLRTFGLDSVRELVEAGPDVLAQVAAGSDTGSDAEPVGTLSDATAVLPPIPDPRRNVFCVGSNYRTHILEGDRPRDAPLPPVPVIFTKPYTSLSGHGAKVPLHPSATEKVDWEAEIAVVVGHGGINIAEEDVLDHVFGYALGNDVSARDLQRAGGDSRRQWFKGKSLDGHAPMGPTIVAADEIQDPAGIEVELRVNGQVRQRFQAKDMIHSISVIVSYLSRGMRLMPGDIVFTGTSDGVGLWHDPPIFLADGDVVEISSPQLGVLRNTFVDVDGLPEQ